MMIGVLGERVTEITRMKNILPKLEIACFALEIERRQIHFLCSFLKVMKLNYVMLFGFKILLFHHDAQGKNVRLEVIERVGCTG